MGINGGEWLAWWWVVMEVGGAVWHYKSVKSKGARAFTIRLSTHSTFFSLILRAWGLCRFVFGILFALKICIYCGGGWVFLGMSMY